MQNLLNLFDEDPSISEIFVNGPNRLVCLHRDGADSQPICDLPRDHQGLTVYIQEFAFEQGVRLDWIRPYNGGAFKHKNFLFRWHSVLPPIASEGPIFCLRRHNFQNIHISHFQISDENLGQIQNIIKQKFSLLICGMTSSGKTTFLHALLKQFFENRRVVLIEDLAEIELSSPKWVRLCARPPSAQNTGEVSLFQLYRESLRLRPDHLVLGEIRDQEVGLFFQMASSGHGAVFATLHADSLEDVRNRFEGKDTKDVCCLFLERGNPPRVLRIEKLPS